MIENYKDKTIVFFGDSITDTCRTVQNKYTFGGGFVNMVKTEIDICFPQLNINIYNEGISGNKTEDLINRIDDVISKKPDTVFLLIGINDIWHPYDQNIIPDIKEIINRINYIIDTLKENQSEVVLLTPFLFPTNEHFEGLLPLFNELIKQLNAYIDTNNIKCIDTYELLKQSSPFDVTKDSIHPTIFGHGILAQAVINYLTK